MSDHAQLIADAPRLLRERNDLAEALQRIVKIMNEVLCEDDFGVAAIEAEKIAREALRKLGR